MPDVAARLLDLVALLVEHRVTRPALPQGMSPLEWSALRYLANHAPSSLSDAAEVLGVGRPTASRLYQRLEGWGWVHRGPGAGDLRYVALELTEAGRRLVEDVAERRRRELDRLLRRMNPEELRALLNGARAFVQASLQLPDFDPELCLRCQGRAEILCPGVVQALREQARIRPG